MAGLLCYASPSPPKRVHGFRCCSRAPNENKPTPTPQLLKIAVSGVTELLRLFSSGRDHRLDTVSYEHRDELSVSEVDDVLVILKSDYENAYFVTGNFTSAIYEEDCTFEDPTITFRGKELYSRNLKLLVPFFESPSIVLEKIEKGTNSETNFILATWKLRTYLKLPWRPLISIDGKTVYDLGKKVKGGYVSHLKLQKGYVSLSQTKGGKRLVGTLRVGTSLPLKQLARFLLLDLEGLVNEHPLFKFSRKLIRGHIRNLEL